MTRTLPKGIFKRGDVYAVRFSVPTEVQSVVGKKEIIRSLGTKNLGEALGKRAEVLEQIRTSLFSDFEEPVAPKASTTHPRGTRISTTVRETAHR